MTDVVFHSSALPSAERFPGWCELAAASFFPARMHSEHREDFQASMRLRTHGPVQFTTVSTSTMTATRSSILIRRSDPEMYFLALVHRGSLGLDHPNGEVGVSSGELVLYDSSSPFSAHVIASASWARKVMVSIPKTLLPIPQGKVESLLGRRISDDDGLGDILPRLINHAALSSSTEIASDARIGSALLDLLSVLLGRMAGDVPVPPEARHHELLLRIRAFIARYLGDPRLTPQMIAEAHGISLRQLNRLFRQEELPVAAWVRQRRLAQCHRDLADPALRSQAVYVIAHRWGFTDAPSFSRAFRSCYGMSPTEHRQAALRAAGHANAKNRSEKSNGSSSRPQGSET